MEKSDDFRRQIFGVREGGAHSIIVLCWSVGAPTLAADSLTSFVCRLHHLCYLYHALTYTEQLLQSTQVYHVQFKMYFNRFLGLVQQMQNVLKGREKLLHNASHSNLSQTRRCQQEMICADYVGYRMLTSLHTKHHYVHLGNVLNQWVMFL